MAKIEWNPMKIIMRINLQWRIKLFKNNEAVTLLKMILEDFVEFSKSKNFIPIFIFLPQKDDLLFIKNNFNFYNEFITLINNIEGLDFINITNSLLQHKEIDKLYSDENEYGGHFSSTGNKIIAELIFDELSNISLEK